MTNSELNSFFIKQITATAQGIQKIVCEKNSISLFPTSGAQLVPIPVFEDAPASLLINANIGRMKTDLHWALNKNFLYLPAYYKRIRDANGKLRNEIVITTENYCEARFFAAKEFMHCFVDDDGYPATKSIALVNELIESLALGLTSAHQSPEQTIVDEVAWIGAMEYLIPSSWVPLLLRVYNNIVAHFPKVNAYLHVAQIIRVPENLLRARFRTALTEEK